MKKIITSTLITGLLITACSTAKHTQRAVTATPSVQQSPAVTMKPVDSMAVVKDQVKNMFTTPENFTTFYGKAKADFSSDKASGNATVFIHMQKDSAIWMSVTGPLNIEGARILITQDSVKILNKLDGTVHLSSIQHLQQLTKLPLGFTDFQNVILGQVLMADSSLLNYTFKPDSVIVSVQQAAITSVYSFIKSTLMLGESRHITNDKNAVDATVNYSNYNNVNGISFSTNRIIVLSGRSPMQLKLDFRDYNFNQPQTFPFTISKNYTIKYD